MNAGRTRIIFCYAAAGILTGAFLISSAAAAGDATKGALDVSSNPSGAEVYLNDEFIGYTPLTVTDLYPGIHYVRLEMPGYSSWEKIFEIKEGESTYIAHSLDESVGEAFAVNTEPDG